MKRTRLQAVSRFFSIVVVVAIMFGTAGFLALVPAHERPSLQAATTQNTSDSELHLPNYDYSVITNNNLTKPTVTSFGEHPASYYPSYTNQLSKTDFTDDKKKIIWDENDRILTNTKNLFDTGKLNQSTLQKHVSADGQFSAATPDALNKAPRVEKVITVNTKIQPRSRSLGLFAPAGEIITITIDESLVGKNLTVNIGYPTSGSDFGSRNKDTGAIGGIGNWPNSRMAKFYLSFKLTQAVTQIGSPLGGIITLTGAGSGLGNFSIKVSGAIDMPDYQLGVSTKDDWQKILAAPSPYVWLLTPFQYFAMPKAFIKDIADPYPALLWWYKASMISMYAMGRNTPDNHLFDPIINVYDSYVPAGEAVAFVWGFVTYAPCYWCPGVLNYDSIMHSGTWGALHEYNHHHQASIYASTQWGIGYTDENTNNVLNAAIYTLLSDVAAARSETNTAFANSWEAVSDPYSNYRRAANASANITSFNDVSNGDRPYFYTDLIHTFGAGRFLDFLRAQYGLIPVDGYTGTNLTEDDYLTTEDGFALFTSLFFKRDFTDYFTNVWHFNLSKSVQRQIKKYNFNDYFSINNLYAVGVKGVETGRPYQINAHETTVLKLDEYTNCSVNNYQLVKLSKPAHGTLVNHGDGTYSYTPAANFTADSFDLVYHVTLNGKTYQRTLVVKLAAAGTTTNVYPAYIDFSNAYLNLFYTDGIKYTPVSATCLDDNGNAVLTTPSGGNINALFDGNKDTGFHTAYQGKTTPFPHNYYFTFENATLFNTISLYSQGYNSGSNHWSPGDYDVYMSNDGVNYQPLAIDNRSTGPNTVLQLNQTVTTKYVKLVVKNNFNGGNFTHMTEIEFKHALNMGTNYHVYTATNSALKYDNQWRTETGHYINNQAQHTANGKVKFTFTGTDLMVYSTNDKSTITIDGVLYTIPANRTNYTPSFAIEGLKAEQHTVEIAAVNMSLDWIKFQDRTYVAPTPARVEVDILIKGPINWLLLIGVLLLVIILCVGVGCAVYLICNKKTTRSRRPKATPRPTPRPTPHPVPRPTAHPLARTTTQNIARPTAPTTARPTTSVTARPTVQSTPRPTLPSTARPTSSVTPSSTTVRPTTTVTARPTSTTTTGRPTATVSARPTQTPTPTTAPNQKLHSQVTFGGKLKK